MKIDIFMPVFIGDYLKDTRHLSTEEHGAYFLILLEMWIKGGKLPFSTLHRIALFSPEKFDKVWVNIEQFFTKKNGEITQKRLRKELELSNARRKAAKNNGLKGGRPKTQLKPIGKPNGKPNRNPQETSSPSPSLNKRVPPKRKHSFPESPFFNRTVFAEKFKDWTKEKMEHYYDAAFLYSGSNGGRYLDWGLTVMGWARKDEKKGMWEGKSKTHGFIR